MTKFKWKVLDIEADGELITKVHYYVTADDGKNIAETEGYYEFKNPELKVPFEEVLHNDLVQWVEIDSTTNGINPIKSRLQEQLDALANNKQVKAPWVKETFKIGDIK